MFKLNKSQEAVVLSNDRLLLVDATAGTGKTRTMVELAKKRIEDGKSVIMITYTNAAAHEIASRLGTQAEYIGTIHAFAYRELRILGERHNFRVKLLSEKEITEILEKILKNFKSVSLRAILHFLFPNEDTKDFIPSPKEKEQVAEVGEFYAAYKRQNGVYDFTDLPRYLVEMLKRTKDVIAVNTLIIDEVQDASEDEVELIKIIKAQQKVCIGDPRQSIYGFRNDGFDTFFELVDFGFKIKELDENYRSSKAVLENAGLGDLTNHNTFVGDVNLEPTFWQIKEMFDKNPTVLCRTNRRVREVQNYYPNVMTVHAAKGLEFDNVVTIKFKYRDKSDTNVHFVAKTRAKNNYMEIPFDKFQQYFKAKNFTNN